MVKTFENLGLRSLRLVLTGTLIALCLLLAETHPALAYEHIDANRDCSLALAVVDDEGAVTSMDVQLWRVGSMSETAEIKLDGAFADYAVDVSGSSSTDWGAAARALAAYTERDGIAPDATVVTDSTGHAVFDGLSTGLYLLAYSEVQADGSRVSCAPELVTLPLLDEANDTWTYGATISPKFERELIPATTSISVFKTWKGADDNRPTSVAVQLLCDGVVAEEVELSAANGWQHTWDGLDAARSWSVAEKHVSDGYTVGITQTDDGFTITNTAQTPPTPPDGRLPQTGTLWHLVPPMAGAGLVLFALGWYRRNRSHGR